MPINLGPVKLNELEGKIENIEKFIKKNCKDKRKWPIYLAYRPKNSKPYQLRDIDTANEALCTLQHRGNFEFKFYKRWKLKPG